MNKTKSIVRKSKSKYPVIDLFCGVGGLSHGFRLEKFNLLGGFDIDASCKYAYEKNNLATFHQGDLATIDPEEIANMYPENAETRILVGCAPCQAFSSYSYKYKENDKWKLLYAFGEIVKSIEPEIISMENVPTLTTYNGGQVFEDFVSTLKAKDYFVTHFIVDTSDYGVPQSRKRLILFASKFGEIQVIKPTHKENKVTVRNAIGHLPKIEAGETHPKDKMHRSRSLSELNLKRIKHTPEGGGWKNWPTNLRLDCHKKESGKSFGSVYGRMKWDAIAPTMTTQCTGYGNGRFGHPEQDRAISLREAAIIQSFPDYYDFINPKTEFNSSNIEMHIGNAVPVRLGEVVAKSIRNHLREYGR